VRASLIEIMCARDEWPFEYEWSRIAPSGLGAAIKRQHKRWAAEFAWHCGLMTDLSEDRIFRSAAPRVRGCGA
jgi:hypothetical protein